MPYIKQDERKHFDMYIDMLADLFVDAAPGQRNYIITRLLSKALANECTYNSLNEIIGVLECVKLEVYRRITAPYEDKKRDENGEVFF